MQDGEAKELIRNSIIQSKNDNHIEALIGLRKAFFIAYEHQYCIYDYKELNENEHGLLGAFALLAGGSKAHYWKKNKQWIDKNVKKPLDYVQVNHDQLKTDCLELGVSTVDIENFRRLTPEVVKTEKNAWQIEYSTIFAANEVNRENFNYCLDLLINFLLKKQELTLSKKFPKEDKYITPPPIYVGRPLFQKPSRDSMQVGTVETDYYYSVDRIVSGFDPSEKFLYVHLYPQNNESPYEGHIWGYLLDEEN